MGLFVLRDRDLAEETSCSTRAGHEDMYSPIMTRRISLGAIHHEKTSEGWPRDELRPSA